MNFYDILILISLAINFAYLWVLKLNIYKLILYNLSLFLILFIIKNNTILLILVFVNLMWFSAFYLKGNKQ